MPDSLHTHSTYCDGEATLREMVEAAVVAGLGDYGVSSHAPLPFSTDWNMPLNRTDAYWSEIDSLRSEFSGRIRIWRGLEIDHIPVDSIRGFQDREIRSRNFDYFVGSVHFLGPKDGLASFDGSKEEFQRILDELYGGDIQALVRDYYARVTTLPQAQGVRIAAHFDLVKRWNADKSYFTGDEPWYREAAASALEALAGSDLALELNTSGWRKHLGEPYPAPWILERASELEIPIIITADAHAPEQITWEFNRARQLLDELNITPVTASELLR